MVKSLVDILAEIEEKQPVRRFQAGGMGGDETPADPGQDDTLGEEDEGPGPDITEEQSEPSDKLIQAISELYAAEDPREDTLGSLPSDPRNNIVSRERGTDVLKGQAGDKDRLGTDKEEHEYGFFDFLVDALKTIGIMAAPVTGGASLGLTATVGGLGTKGLGTGKEGFEVTYEPFGLAQKALEEVGAIDQPVLSATLGEFGTGKGQQPGTQLAAKSDPQTNIEEVAGSQHPSQVVSPPSTTQVASPPSAKEDFSIVDDKEESSVVDDVFEFFTPSPSEETHTPPHNDFWGSEPDPNPSPASLLATQIVENAVVDPDKKEEEQVASWSFDPARWYPAAQGGPIAAFSPGGLAGMMNRGMMDNQLMAQQPLRFDPYSGNRPARPPQFGGIGLPRPSGFFDPRPSRPPQQPRLEPETYFHEHEGGKVTYPNFPKPFVNPPTDRNPIKDPKRPRPVQTVDTLNEQFTSPKLEEAPTSDSYKPLQPVPPISISETTATAMEPEAVKEATQTTIEEARPVPREIDIQMPENVTATLDFPEEVRGTANYRWGGLADIGRSLAPMVAGWALGPMGYIPGMLGGAATSYALGGRKRSGLDAIKGALMGYSGAGLGRVGEAAAGAGTGKTAYGPTQRYAHVPGTPPTTTTPGVTGGKVLVNDPSKFAAQFDKGPMADKWFAAPSNYGTRLGKQASGLWNALATGEGDIYKALASEMIPSASAAVGAAGITPPSEMPEFTEIEVEQIKTMTPEERKQWLANRRKKYADSPMMRTQTFTPPDVDIGWQPNFAAEGGIMEIDEEMESGSFVLPADVVSNVGDGSSDAGHRRLTELFGGGDDEYALGGGTGILKGPIKGPGSGLDDLIQTGIDGVRVARLSTDEFVVPKDVVRRLGEGSTKAGSEKLYDFMKDVRLKKHGTSEQPKEIHMSGLRKMV